MVPRGELAVIWDLAAAINVGSWRSPWRSNLGKPGIQFSRLTRREIHPLFGLSADADLDALQVWRF